MKIRIATWIAVAGCLGASAAAGDPSPLALEWAPPVESSVTPQSSQPSDLAFASGIVVVRGAPTTYATRFRPRTPGDPHHYPSRGPRPESFSQIHMGFMDPEGREDPDFMIGFRGGVAVERPLQIGAQVDWHHRGNSVSSVVSQGPGPGGTVIVTHSDLARSSSDLVPILAFMQISAGDRAVIPYFGGAAGFEILHLSASNYQTGEQFEGTFSGFGWQAWGGVALPFAGRARVNSEVFVNGADLSRDIADPYAGQVYRETVNMDGVGLRFGLAWGF